ncbi:hypothetical protein [Methylibium petroleiphilum]
MSGDIHPVFLPFLESIVRQPEQLARAARKAEPRRFTGESPTGFGDLATDIKQLTEAEREQERQDAADIAARFGEGLSLCERDERLELERDMHDDMVRRSA